MNIAKLRVTVFERAAEMIRAGKWSVCCLAIDDAAAARYSPELKLFWDKHRVIGQTNWFLHIKQGPKRQKARIRALLRCAELIRQARKKGKKR